MRFRCIAIRFAARTSHLKFRFPWSKRAHGQGLHLEPAQKRCISVRRRAARGTRQPRDARQARKREILGRGLYFQPAREKVRAVPARAY
jgi:hypothetical protein